MLGIFTSTSRVFDIFDCLKVYGSCPTGWVFKYLTVQLLINVEKRTNICSKVKNTRHNSLHQGYTFDENKFQVVLTPFFLLRLDMY